MSNVDMVVAEIVSEAVTITDLYSPSYNRPEKDE